MPNLDIWIAFRTDFVTGDGSAANPYDGSTQALFDSLMNEIGESTPNSTIHLGPGVFETKGYPNSGGWQIKAGMKIVGAGMDVTTLKLVSPSASHNYVIGHDATHAGRADFAEVSDLTIDCNLAAPGGCTVHGAVRLMGDHVKIHRVKAIHWGSGAEVGAICTVFSIVTVDAEAEIPELVHGGMEDCLAIEPSYTSGAAIAINVGGVEGESFTQEYHGKSPYIRNCYIDGGSAPNLTGILAGWCRGGVVEGNQIYNVAVAIAQTGRSSRDLIVRNNFIKNVSQGISLGAGTASSLGDGSLARSGVTATINEISTAALQVGDRVWLTTTPDMFSGVYVVASILDSDSFTVTTPVTAANSADVLAVYPIRSTARAIVEGNVIELVSGDSAVSAVLVDDNNTSFYLEAPDYVHGDIIIRNNKVRAVDGVAPLDASAVLIQVSGAKNLQVSNNMLETTNPRVLRNDRCGNVTYFNNRTPSGRLLEGVNGDTGLRYGELQTDSDFALIMSLFARKVVG